ncbi:hypothetical protein IGB42_00820 [Andreprevotia sp. IGB-42]|uniref:acyltransferase family protein n=1 Tax=Andreprevotia sp. IGB-42 TaxID=2497473 RepID=UPI00135997F5|nr:acyltransferase family protein [Andreprevotia sp. IGB-42]KAF0814765.1 hypothetical protein IGB42_00820 [Andreprevotia sp. IGB-42]
MRNTQFDLMLAIGIIFVLMGHSHQPAFLFYPAYAFHMGLFFFISGYFFKPPVALAEKARFIARKSRTQLLPYLALLLLFGVLTQLLRKAGLNLGAEMDMNSLVWGVFERADQFNLYLSAWFLMTLYLVNVVAAIAFGKQLGRNLVVMLVAAALFYQLLEMGKLNYGDWHLQLIRCGFGFFFFGLGYLFRVFEAALKPLLLKPAALIGLFVLVNVLNVHFGNLSYSILLGNIGNELVWVPVLSTLAIILMIYAAAHFLAQICTEKSLLLLIGRNTFAIMIWHFFAFLLLNLLLFALGLVKFEQLSDVYFRYQPEKTWVLYLAAGLFIPIGIAKLYRRAIPAVQRFALASAALANVQGEARADTP